MSRTRTMHPRETKQTAEDFFGKGMTVRATASEMRIPLSTLANWHAEWAKKHTRKIKRAMKQEIHLQSLPAPASLFETLALLIAEHGVEEMDRTYEQVKSLWRLFQPRTQQQAEPINVHG